MLRRRMRSGWSLVEILLTVAVFSVLAALAFTAYGPAKRSARIASCTSNLHQIGLALEIYASDHDGRLPSAPPVQLGHQYLADRSLLFCPAEERVGMATASSYSWRMWMPDGTPLGVWKRDHSDAVIAVCDNHLQRPVTITEKDAVELGKPVYPMVLLLRADGRVDKIPLDQRRNVAIKLSGIGMVSNYVYPKEPWYDGGV